MKRLFAIYRLLCANLKSQGESFHLYAKLIIDEHYIPVIRAEIQQETDEGDRKKLEKKLSDFKKASDNKGLWSGLLVSSVNQTTKLSGSIIDEIVGDAISETWQDSSKIVKKIPPLEKNVNDFKNMFSHFFKLKLKELLRNMSRHNPRVVSPNTDEDSDSFIEVIQDPHDGLGKIVFNDLFSKFKRELNEFDKKEKKPMTKIFDSWYDAVEANRRWNMNQIVRDISKKNKISESSLHDNWRKVQEFMITFFKKEKGSNLERGDKKRLQLDKAASIIATEEIIAYEAYRDFIIDSILDNLRRDLEA